VGQHGVAHGGRDGEALAERAPGPADHGERVGALEGGVRLGGEPDGIVLERGRDVLGPADQWADHV
jgi:hypothetical protein